MQLESVCSLPVEDLLVTRLEFTPEGHHFVLGHKDLSLYEVLSGRVVRVFPFDAFVGSLAFSGDGRYLASVSENDGHPRTTGLARVFDVDTGAVVLEVRTRFPIETGCFLENAEGTVFLYKETVSETASDGGTRRSYVRARHLPSGNVAADLDLGGWEVRRIAAGSNLALLGLDAAGKPLDVEGASLNVRSFRVGLFSYPEGKPLRVYALGIGAGLSRFSPDGCFLALETVNFRSNRHDLAVVDVAHGTHSSLLPLDPGVVPALAFSEDSGWLASLTEEPEIPGALLRLWNPASREVVGQTTFGGQYHTIALNWRTRRIAGLGGGRCEIGLIHL